MKLHWKLYVMSSDAQLSMEFHLKDALYPLVWRWPESHPLDNLWFQLSCDGQWWAAGQVPIQAGHRRCFSASGLSPEPWKPLRSKGELILPGQESVYISSFLSFIISSFPVSLSTPSLLFPPRQSTCTNILIPVCFQVNTNWNRDKSIGKGSGRSES